jgi:hypothetical protein
MCSACAFFSISTHFHIIYDKNQLRAFPEIMGLHNQGDRDELIPRQWGCTIRATCSGKHSICLLSAYSLPTWSTLSLSRVGPLMVLFRGRVTVKPFWFSIDLKLWKFIFAVLEKMIFPPPFFDFCFLFTKEESLFFFIFAETTFLPHLKMCNVSAHFSI